MGSGGGGSSERRRGRALHARAQLIQEALCAATAIALKRSQSLALAQRHARVLQRRGRLAHALAQHLRSLALARQLLQRPRKQRRVDSRLV